MKPGIRLTVLASNFKGSMAEISAAITQHGGLITAFNVLPGENASNWGAHLKVSEISRDELVAAIKPHVVEIVDLREM